MAELERLVLDRTALTSFFVVAANYAAAVAVADCISTVVVDMDGRNRLDVTVEVTALGSMTTMFVAVRSSGKARPDLGTDSDWSRMNRVPVVNTTTGVDASVPALASITVTATGRHTISLPVSNRYVSAVVWTDGANGQGNVYMYRGS